MKPLFFMRFYKCRRPLVKLAFSFLFLFIMKPGHSQSALHLQWAKDFIPSPLNSYFTGELNTGRAVAVDMQSNVYSAGILVDTVDFDPGPGTYTLVGGGELHYEIYISKLSPNGDLIWAEQIPQEDEGKSIKIAL